MRCYRVISLTLALFSVLLTSAYADRIVQSVTINGATSVVVSPSTSLTAEMTVQTTYTGDWWTDDWRSTAWQINDSSGNFVSYSCVDTANHDSSGTYSESFTIPAPSAEETYTLYSAAYSNDSCSNGQSAVYTMTGAIIVTNGDPVRSYYFDESGWDGTAGEVVDEVSAANGTAVNGADTISAGVNCRAGSFDGVDDYVEMSNLSDVLNGTASLAFWIRTTQAGNDVSWLAPGVTGVEDNGGTNDIFWGWLDASGHIGIGTGNTYTAKSTTLINDGDWHHVVLTRNSSSGAYTVYIDGVLERSGTLATGTIGNSYFSIGRVETTSGTPIYFAGNLDELYVYDSVINAAKITELYNDSRTCLSCFSDDFNRTDLGSDWAVSSRYGSFGVPRIVNDRLRLTDSSTYVATVASLLRLFPGAGNKIVYEFDQYAYNGSGADGMTVVLSDAAVTPVPGGYGGSLGYAQRSGQSGFTGGWLGMAIDEYGNFANDNEGRGDGGVPTARVLDSVTVRGSGAGNDRLSPAWEQW